MRRDVLDIVEPGTQRGATAVRKDKRAYVLAGGVAVTVYPKGAWLDHARRGRPRQRRLTDEV